MKNVIRIILLLFLCSNIYSQEVDIENEEPKIGLVLAGGGAWGFAHVGVLRVLEDNNIPISYVTGTSIGSIIGGLYSMGYSVDDLEKLIYSTDWLNILNDTIERKDIGAASKSIFQDYLLEFSIKEKNISLPGGIIEGQKIDYLFSQLHWDAKNITDFTQFPIPFKCVATDIKTGNPVVLGSGDITDSVRASMSIPGVFSPIIIDDKILVDGMFSMNLPVSVVKDMGADIVIAVNFDLPETGLADYTSATGALYHSFTMNMGVSTREQLPLADIVISPNVSGISTFNYDRVDEIYKRGIVAAKNKIDDLKKFSNPSLCKNIRNKRLPKTGKVFINSVEVKGTNKTISKSIEKIIGVEENKFKTFSNRELEDKIKYIYSLDLFKIITYKIDNNKLIITVKEKDINTFSLAMNYDVIDNVSLLLDVRSRVYSDFNLFSDFSVRLGERINIKEILSLNLGFVSLVGLYSETNFTVDQYPIISLEDTAESYEFRHLFGVGLTLSKSFLGSVAIGYDFFNFNNDISNTFLLQGLLLYDTLNRTVYPDRGVSLQLVENWAIPTEIGTHYSNTLFKSQFLLPIYRDQISLILGLNGGLSVENRNLKNLLGISSVYDIPVNQKIYLGGYRAEKKSISLLGYRRHEISSDYSAVVNTGIQIQPYDNLFIQARFDGAAVSNTNEDFLKEIYWGYGLLGGIITPLGPVEVSITGNKSNDFIFNITLGYDF